MRKLVIGMALASTALATPAMAREGAWYIELDGGAMVVEDFDFDVGAAPGVGPTEDFASLDSEYGYDFGIISGYDFGAFRLEAEAAYRGADPDVLTTNGTVRIPNTGTTPFASSLGTFDGVAGDATALSVLVNALLDFGPDDGMQGFIGGGVGVARVDLDYAIGTSGTPGFIDDEDTGFAWQLLAGVRAPVTDTIDAGLKYRFFNADNIEMVDSAGRDIETRWRSHSLLGTLTFNFGGEPPVEEMIPVAPVVPPPPPAPVVRPACNTGPYIVFFDWDRSDITPEAATILDNAVAAYGNCGTVPIMLAGYTDRSGSVQYNQGLSERRNASVRAYLNSRNIPDSVITSQAFGESNPRVPTADGVRELQNRRVEITYGPGSGM